jgi:2-polyprenyl-3-methyl-5-hydroxy-6-metoxy-1,4-benzoquinol methylase
MKDLPEIDVQRAYYDDRWEAEDFANLLQLDRTIVILRALRSLNMRAPKILDFGCGTGWLAGILGRFGPTTGIDLSERAIEKARERYRDVRFISGDLYDARMQDEKFDVVVSQEVIEHVPDQPRYLEIIAQLLRPGGYLILTTPNARNFSHWESEDLENWGLQPIEHWLTTKQLRHLVEPNFSVVNVHTIIPGFAKRGIFRILNSAKLMAVLNTFKLVSLYEYLIEVGGFGLTIVLLARRLVKSG